MGLMLCTSCSIIADSSDIVNRKWPLASPDNGKTVAVNWQVVASDQGIEMWYSFNMKRWVFGRRPIFTH